VLVRLPGALSQTIPLEAFQGNFRRFEFYLVAYDYCTNALRPTDEYRDLKLLVVPARKGKGR